MQNFVKYKNFTKNVFDDIEKEDRALRGKAGMHIRGRIKAKINKKQPSMPGEPPGKVTGNLLKGLKVRNKKTVALVGFVPPAYHAPLLEFGTSKTPAHPFLFSTFAEEASAVKVILSGERIK